MANLKNLDDRIVKFKRTSSSGEAVTKEVEIRKLLAQAGVPRSLTVRLTNPLNVITTFQFDRDAQKFVGTLGTYSWESDFDWKDFISSNILGNTDTYIKNPRRAQRKV